VNQSRHQAKKADRGEEGFTLIELTVAMSLLAIVMIGFAGAVYGGMGAWAASRQRSAFVEIASAELETLRAVPYDVLGVNTTKDTNWATAYPSNQRGGRDVVNVTSVDTTAQAPYSVTTVTSSPVKGITLPYTVRRWVTWTDTAGGSTHVIKRLEVEVDWTENNRSARSLTLISVIYPGDIGVLTPNINPVSSFTVAPSQSINALAVATFNAAASSDADNDAITYAWNFGDLITGSGVSPTHAYALPGTYTVLLTVTDARGGIGTSSKVMTVASAIAGTPVASFTRTPTTGVAPMAVNVDATASYNPLGGALTYTWAWGDSTANGTGVNATHTYAAAGTFTITLTVKNTSNVTATTTATVTVSPLNCDVTAGSFKNPSTNATANDIKVAASKKPSNSSFTFYATSNTGCTSISARIPYSGGTWSVALAQTGTVGAVVSWSATSTTASKFNTGNSQTGEFWSPGSDGTADKFSFTFNVHT
jgi:prepilin-type N-terminal cleavage/methylation domain-containing protein